MSLRETLLGAAEAKATAALKDAEVPTLAAPGAPSSEGLSVGFLVEEEAAVGSRVVDPEVAEALARTKALEFTATELSMLKGLTAAGLQRELANSKGKEFTAAAKLVVLMAKIERDSYLELRKQSLESQPKQRRTLFQFPSQYLGQMQAGLREGLRDVTPAKEPRDA
jgi:hypothetical protein